MLYQRKPASGISSMITKIASAAQRNSSNGITDESWRQSICRDTYQKHAPVTSSLAASIAAFLAAQLDRRGVSKSLATPLLIRWSLSPIDCTDDPSRSLGKCRRVMVMAERNAEFKPQIAGHHKCPAKARCSTRKVHRARHRPRPMQFTNTPGRWLKTSITGPAASAELGRGSRSRVARPWAIRCQCPDHPTARRVLLRDGNVRRCGSVLRRHRSGFENRAQSLRECRASTDYPRSALPPPTCRVSANRVSHPLPRQTLLL